MAVFLQDTFTGESSLQSHNADTGGSGWTVSTWDGDTANVSGGTLQGDTFSSSYYYHTASPDGSEYDITAVLQWTDVNNATQGGVMGRYTEDISNPTYYIAHFANDGTVTLSKRLSGGSESTLGTYTHGIGTNTSVTLKLEIRDATKKVYINGVERISSSNNEITGAGKVGVRVSDETRMTSLSADSVGGTSTTKKFMTLGVG